MPVPKIYNPSTDQWEPVAIGPQGEPGTNGTNGQDGEAAFSSFLFIGAQYNNQEKLGKNGNHL